MIPIVLTKNPKITDKTTKNTVQFKVNFSLYTIAFLMAAIAIVVTPVHDMKKTEDIVSVNASRN